MIGLLAFYLKGITGAGPAVVIISFSSLIIDPKSTIVLASFVNVFGGLAMLRVDKVELGRRYWIPVALLMGVGSIAGIIGPTLAGWVFDTTRDYRLIWFILCGLNAIAVWLTSKIKPLTKT